MAQSTVSDRMTIGFPGMLADATRSKDAVSKTSEEASDEIPFGVMVAQGANDDGVLLLGAITDKLVGIVIHEDSFLKDLQLGDVGLKPNVTMSVLNKGRIYVQVEDAVTPASAVHVRAVATGAEVAGAFRGTADGTDTIPISGFAKWITSAGVGELAVLEVDMTNSRQAP